MGRNLTRHAEGGTRNSPASVASRTTSHCCSAFRVPTSAFQRFANAKLSVSSSRDRKSTRLNSSHGYISYAVFCLKKKKNKITRLRSYLKVSQTHRYIMSNTRTAHE